MEFFDSHAHYNDEKFANDLEEVITKIKNAGVSKTIIAGYSLDSSKKALAQAKKYDFMYAICGISPNDINENCKEELKQIEQMEDKKLVAIGEIGLDYYWNKENKDLQKAVFIKQINIANKKNKPIVIHSRDAYKDTIEILKTNPVSKKGIFHCCQLNQELVKEALSLGYYISLAGPITFKNAKGANEIIQAIPNEKLLIETDSPYLAPEPIRGTKNDSGNIIWIAKKIAEVKQIPLEEVAKITYENAERIFEIA